MTMTHAPVRIGAPGSGDGTVQLQADATQTAGRPRGQESESPSPRQDGVLCAEEAEAACAAGGGTAAPASQGHAKGRLWPGSVRSTFVLRRAPRNAERGPPAGRAISTISLPASSCSARRPRRGPAAATSQGVSKDHRCAELSRRDVAGDLRLSQTSFIFAAARRLPDRFP